MDNKILYSPKALEDMDSIADYISNVLHNPSASKNIIHGIYEKLESIRNFPDIGSRLVVSGNIFSGYRWVGYKNYMVFYHFEKNAIFVDRVLNSQQDYLQILFNE